MQSAPGTARASHLQGVHRDGIKRAKDHLRYLLRTKSLFQNFTSDTKGQRKIDTTDVIPHVYKNGKSISASEA